MVANGTKSTSPTKSIIRKIIMNYLLVDGLNMFMRAQARWWQRAEYRHEDWYGNAYYV